MLIWTFVIPLCCVLQITKLVFYCFFFFLIFQCCLVFWDIDKIISTITLVHVVHCFRFYFWLILDLQKIMFFCFCFFSKDLCRFKFLLYLLPGLGAAVAPNYGSDSRVCTITSNFMDWMFISDNGHERRIHLILCQWNSSMKV